MRLGLIGFVRDRYYQAPIYTADTVPVARITAYAHCDLTQNKFSNNEVAGSTGASLSGEVCVRPGVGQMAFEAFPISKMPRAFCSF